MLLIDFLWNS